MNFREDKEEELDLHPNVKLMLGLTREIMELTTKESFNSGELLLDAQEIYFLSALKVADILGQRVLKNDQAMFFAVFRKEAEFLITEELILISKKASTLMCISHDLI